MTASNKNRAKIGLESLETRDQMSVSYSIIGSSLVFTGDGGNTINDYLEVRDNGRAGPGNISYRTSPTGTFRVINEDITYITAIMGRGNDTFIHTMTGSLASGL